MTQTLPTAVLGRTGLEVSRLGYGTALRNQPNHEQWGRLLNTVLVLRYTLAHPYSHTNIVGTSNLDHLQENIRGILRGPLSEDVYVESKRRLDAAGETPSPVE